MLSNDSEWKEQSWIAVDRNYPVGGRSITVDCWGYFLSAEISSGVRSKHEILRR